MSKVRVRRETGNLFFDFSYRGVRCREQTTLNDSAVNRRLAQRLLRDIDRAIADGSFDYAKTFPGSPRASQFEASRLPSLGLIPPGWRMSPAQGVTADHVQSPRFAEFAETWFNECSPQWKSSHQRGVREVLDRNLIPVFGNREVARISKADVLAFRADLARLPGKRGKLGAARINKIMCFLRQILNEAADRYDFLPAFRGIKPLKMKKADVQPFSLAEVQELLNVVRADYRNYLTVRFFTGLRTGEINGLCWRHIDWERGLILVRETLVGGSLEDGAKTAGSVRDVPMLPMVRSAIEAQWAQRDPSVDWVFPTRGGGPIDANNFNNRVWRPLLRYLGLAERRPYQTRHTAATLMLAAGENPEWIARVLGHANTEMLFKVYSRFVPNLTRRDGLAMAGLLESRLGDVEGKGDQPPSTTDKEVPRR